MKRELFNYKFKKKLIINIDFILAPIKRITTNNKNTKFDYTITSEEVKERQRELFWKKVQRKIYYSTENEILIDPCPFMYYLYMDGFLSKRGFNCEYHQHGEYLVIYLYDDDE